MNQKQLSQILHYLAEKFKFSLHSVATIGASCSNKQRIQTKLQINHLEVTMLKNLKNILIGVFSAIIVVAIGASAYSAFASPDAAQPAAPAVSANLGQGNGNGNGNANAGSVTDHTGNGNGTGISVLDIPASDLSPEETAALLFMREEEKLARDVYNTLYEIWGQPTFTNIAASEQTHMDEVKLLLERYSLADPAL
jgi:hypothetical protein